MEFAKCQIQKTQQGLVEYMVNRIVNSYELRIVATEYLGNLSFVSCPP